MYRNKMKTKPSFSCVRYIKYANLKYRYSFTNFFRSFVLSHYSYWNLGNLLLLCAHPLKRSIIFHIRGPNTQEKVGYILNIYVSSNVHFSRFEDTKFTFLTSFQFALEVMYYWFSGVLWSVIVYLNDIKVKTTFTWVRYFKYAK